MYYKMIIVGNKVTLIDKDFLIDNVNFTGISISVSCLSNYVNTQIQWPC